jgi:hypothetical protein
MITRILGQGWKVRVSPPAWNNELQDCYLVNKIPPIAIEAAQLY